MAEDLEDTNEGVLTAKMKTLAVLGENDDEELHELQLSKKKKKKKKHELHEETTTKTETCAAANENRDYAYPEMLSRLFGLLEARNMGATTANTKGTCKKYVLPPPVLRPMGTRRTVWSNFAMTCQILHRPL